MSKNANINAVPNATDTGVNPQDVLRELLRQRAEQDKAIAAAMAAAGISTKGGRNEEQNARWEQFQLDKLEVDLQLEPLLEASRKVSEEFTAWCLAEFKETGVCPVNGAACDICLGIKKTEKGENKMHKLGFRSEEQREKYIVRLQNRKAAAAKVAK